MRSHREAPSSSRLRLGCLKQGSSGLMYACQQGDLPGVVRILGEQVPVSAYRQDRNRRTALHYCRGSAVAGQLVTAAPGLLDSPDRDGLTPLHLAVIQGDTALVSLLIAQGADIDALDNERHSVVHWATVCCELDCLRLLLSAGANPSAPDILGGCPLHYAAQLCGAPLAQGAIPGHALRILKELLNAKSTSVHVVDHEGRSPLLWAAAAGSPEAVIALIKAGAHVEAADRDGLTALHCAASRGNTGCIETLITLCGAAVDVIDCNGCTSLHYAATLGHADATSLLLDLDAAPDRQDRKGRTPAHCACAKGQLETVKILANHKANLWIRNIKGDLPLHDAVASGRRKLVLYLLQLKDGFINSSGHDGKTLLHIAASHDHADICKILLDHGAVVNPLYRTTRDVMVTPLDCALHKGNKSTAKYLQIHGGIPAVKLNAEESNKDQKVKLQSITPTTAVKQTRSSVLRSGGRLSKTDDTRKPKKDSSSDNKYKGKPEAVTTFQQIEHNPNNIRIRTKSLTKVHCSSSSDDSNIEEFCTCIHRCHHGKRLYLLQSPRRLTRKDIKELSKNSHSDSDIHTRSHSRCDKQRDKRSSTSMSERQRSNSRSTRQLKSARSKINRSDSKDNSSDYKERRKPARDRSHSRSNRPRSQRRKHISTEDSDETLSSEEFSSDRGKKYKTSSHSSSKSKTSNKTKTYTRRTMHSYSEEDVSEEEKPNRVSKSVSSSPKSRRKSRKNEAKSPRHISEERIVKRKTLKTETTTKRTVTPNADSQSESESEEDDSEDIDDTVEIINTSKAKRKSDKVVGKVRYRRSVSDEDEIVDNSKTRTKSRSSGRVNEKARSKKSEKQKSSEISELSESDDKYASKKSSSKTKESKTKKQEKVISKSKQKNDADSSLDKPTSKSKDRKKVTSESTKTTTSTMTEKKVKQSKIKQNEDVSDSELSQLNIKNKKQTFTTSESENDMQSSGTKKGKVITEAEIHKTEENDQDVQGMETINNLNNNLSNEGDGKIESGTMDKKVEEIQTPSTAPQISEQSNSDLIEGSIKDTTDLVEQSKEQSDITKSEQISAVETKLGLQTTELAEHITESATELVQKMSEDLNLPSDKLLQNSENINKEENNIKEVKQEAENIVKSTDVEPVPNNTDKIIDSKALPADESKMDNKDQMSLEDKLIGERINQPIAAENFIGSFEATPALHMIEMVPPPERFIQLEYNKNDEGRKESLYTSEDDTTDSSEDSEKFEKNQTPRTAMDDLRFCASEKFEGQSSVLDSSIVDTTAPPSAANTWSSMGSPSRRKKLKRRTKNRSRTLSEEVSERGYESSGMMDSGFEPSPRVITRPKSVGPKAVSKNRKIPEKKVTRPGRAIDRKPGDKNAVNMTTVNQSMQANIRRYYTERIIFQHLLDLKRLQIRSSRAHEAVLVKRAIDQYHRSNPQVARYTDKEFTYEAFERHLYDTLKKLQKVGSSNYKTIAESFIENECKSNPLFCTTKTFRCNHATHAYTGIPCAAYIPLMNHHTIPKPGFPKVPEPSFLPRIKTGEKHDKNAVALELSHGNDKQLITLPSDKLDVNKKYYVTFSVRGSNPTSEAEGKASPKTAKPTK
ncbi:ankycorbin-like [Ctenocephalides felis]|uniref:ankycorbin-like n=1 Tax=Ctenocephalides felis TaxID=7515 RepID=UPI000E6E28AD|nr:ankycorbin-like [Ctenocephalides felis]